MHKRLFARALIEVAMLFRDENKSAYLCVEDAAHLFAIGEYEYAFDRAYASLRYSVGVLSPIYEWAALLNARL